LSLTNTDSFIRGVDIQETAAASCIEIRGVGSLGVINDVVGSTGNTGVGLDMTLNRDMRLLMGQLNANTFTATAGQDVRGAGPVYYVHADYARTDLRDKFNNTIQGNDSTALGQPTFVSNDGTGTIAQYAVCRSTGASTVRAAQADSAANAAGVTGVSQSQLTTGTPTNNAMMITSGASWVQFDSAPSVGNIAYLSTATAGNAQVAVPAVSGSNQKLRLGRVIRVSGTLGYVNFQPDLLSVAADGNP